MSLSSVEAAAAETREDGVVYYVYEHVSQVGAPRLHERARRPQRVSAAATGACCTGHAAALAARRRCSENLAPLDRLGCWLAAGVQGSPTLRALSRETYRHSLAVTGERFCLRGTLLLRGSSARACPS